MQPRWHRLRPRIAFGILLVLALAWEIETVFVSTTLVRAEGHESFYVEEFADGVPVGQTFRMLSDGLQSVDVAFLVDRPTLLTLRCRLFTWNSESRDGWDSVYEWTSTVELSAGPQWSQFSFAPVVHSMSRIYQFQMQQIDAQALDPRAQGSHPRVSVMASVDDSLREGNIILGRFQWVDRDLFFGAHGADSAFEAFHLLDNPEVPKPLRRRNVQIALLSVYTCVLTIFSYYLLVVLPEQDGGTV